MLLLPDNPPSLPHSRQLTPGRPWLQGAPLLELPLWGTGWSPCHRSWALRSWPRASWSRHLSGAQASGTKWARASDWASDPRCGWAREHCDEARNPPPTQAHGLSAASTLPCGADWRGGPALRLPGAQAALEGLTPISSSQAVLRFVRQPSTVTLGLAHRGEEGREAQGEPPRSAHPFRADSVVPSPCWARISGSQGSGVRWVFWL